MRNLYRKVGLGDIAPRAAVTRAAARAAGLKLDISDVQFVLLDERRKKIYDRNYRVLATIGILRSQLDLIVAPGSGPPPHVHSQEEESFLVLEGEMTFQLGEDRIVAGEGTFLNMPVGSLHCFKNESNKTARLLISVAPAGLEQMFFEVGTPLADDAESAPPPSQADIEKLLEAAPRYGVEIKVPH